MSGAGVTRSAGFQPALSSAFGRTGQRRQRAGSPRSGVIAALALLVLAGPARAVLPGEQLADPKLEARARHIGAQLRCLVCQNQSIDDSDATLASDLRIILRERLMAGDSDRQAIDFVVRRYGHYVLLNPPFEPETLLLWLGPGLVLAAGGVWVALMARGRSGAVDAASPLTAEEREQLARRLDVESAS
ncbi:MAG TPA: cytochrome c-type biogenesis protein [Caulobacteraceae bacterium]|nr:cytochrome c-type biogenesis protein [Caulobacteraceae bacterium]